MLAPTTTSCADLSAAESGAQMYSLVAVDRDAGNALRDGDARTLTVGAAGSAPAQPARCSTVATVNGLPRLTWTAPLLERRRLLPHLPRRARRYADRYDRTSGGLITTYTDTDPGTTAHQLLGHRRRQHFNESDPIGPVDVVRHERSRDERGFTLVELLVGDDAVARRAGGDAADVQRRCRTPRTTTTSRNDTTEVARDALDVQARQLRNLAKRAERHAGASTRVAPYDLIFQTSDPSRTWVRYCLDTTNAPASPSAGAAVDAGARRSSRRRVAGDAPRCAPAARGSADWTTTRVVADHVTNRRDGRRPAAVPVPLHRRARPAPASPATYDQVINVSAQTFVDTTPAAASPELRVASGVYLRNQNQPPVASVRRDAVLDVAHGRAQRRRARPTTRAAR